MATKTKDITRIQIDATDAEFTAMLEERAKTAGLIPADFNASRVEAINQGEGAGWEVIFEQDNV